MNASRKLLSSIGADEKFIPYSKWKQMAIDRYGSLDNVVFVCPKCGHKASTKDYTELGFQPSAAGFICLGFFTGEDNRVSGGPCRYSPLAMLNENPILIKIENQCYVRIFDFADDPLRSAEKCLANLRAQSTDEPKKP